jgi:hypothetical protein
MPSVDNKKCVNCGWVWKYFRRPFPTRDCQAAKPQISPGDYLHLAILKWVGEGPTRSCGCNDRIAKMNAWGPSGCRDHLDTIVDWLADEAKKRGWWKYAVAVPGSRYFIKRMVLGAIKKAEDQSSQSSIVPDQQLPISSAGTP